MAHKFKDVMSCLKVIPAAFLVKTPPSHQANNSPPSPGAGENTPQKLLSLFHRQNELSPQNIILYQIKSKIQFYVVSYYVAKQLQVLLRLKFKEETF